MILPDKYYQIIKCTVLTINAVATFLGVITGVSAYNLKK